MIVPSDFLKKRHLNCMCLYNFAFAIRRSIGMQALLPNCFFAQNLANLTRCLYFNILDQVATYKINNQLDVP